MCDRATAFVIRQDDLSSEPTQRLLSLHLEGMREHSPPDAVFALDLSGLRRPEMTVWTAWQGDSIAGVGALKDCGGGLGEIKSMRTHPNHLRQGVAELMLAHIVREARARTMTRLSLETGRGPAFEAAVALYAKHGFTFGDAFGDYRAGSFSQFMHLAL